MSSEVSRSRSGNATPEAPITGPLPPHTDEAPPAGPAQHPTYPPPYPYPYPYAPGSAAPGPYLYPPVERPPRQAHSKAIYWVLGGLGGFMLVGIALVALLAAMLGGIIGSAVGQHEQIATSSRTFAVNGTPNLVLSDSGGNVSIQAGTENQVTVGVTKHAWGGSVATAQGGLSRTSVTMSQNGNAVTVNAEFGAPYFDGGMVRRSVDLLLTVPTRTNVSLNLGGGNIEARQITGAIRLVDGAGNITLAGVQFEAASLVNTGAGNVQAVAAIASNAAVSIHVGAGNVTLSLPAATPAHLDASTGLGNLTITGWQLTVTGAGSMSHRASGDFVASPSATLTVQVGTGNLTLISR